MNDIIATLMQLLPKNKAKAHVGVADFIHWDYSGTLFPLRTNAIVLQFNEAGLRDFIYSKVLSKADKEYCFLPQQRVFATKPKGHLRRTVKLDPVAEYFLYDFVYRNRSVFRKAVSGKRLSFGYRYEDGLPVPVNSSYREFKAALGECRGKFKHHIRFDIAAYFNSIYHHDLTHWVSSRDGVSAEDGEAFGQFTREINAGRSVDFLPQGIFPAKMIGNEFLKFVDLSGQLKSAQLVRFMDDFYLFDDSMGVLLRDFTTIQQLLGQFALNVNPSKTGIDDFQADVAAKVSEIKKSLLEVVEIEDFIETASGVEVTSEMVEVEHQLSVAQVEMLLSFLKDDALEESDAEVILNILRMHSDSMLEYLPVLFARFPNLYKQLHAVCSHVNDKEGLADVLLKFLEESEPLLEYQLFWLAHIVEESLAKSAKFGDLMVKLYDLTGEARIARAKVLEIPTQDFGFKEIRGEIPKSGSSDWTAWAAAVGTRTLKLAERNYMLDYFAKGSPLNHIVATSVKASSE
ncbi:antiviral reverse transcriptase Drt5 [Dyella sp. A6]|uniref:antiviral reverse transcriptase Drt5 n=1 Tax=Dyella aluminiiresistens TaxID=3069105 RepID=UPI002E781C72|nr:antiviral reverse transcriptase Drt5 [Dyella sp. A6]